MTLPPGRDAVSVPGFDASVNPKLTKAAGEVATWVDYLLHPNDNDGPRVYRSKFKEGDSPFPNRNKDLDTKSNEYETVSILENFADDPDAFFRPVQAVAGFRQELIDGSYQQLIKGYFTWKENDQDPGAGAISDLVQYAELNSARFDWMQMRSGWEGKEANAAYLYEEAFIKFQVVTENCLYIVAEHLARYWAIFDKAGTDLLELMNAFTEECAVYEPAGADAGLTLDVMSVVVSAIIAATVTVITTGATALTISTVLKSAASTALNKALNNVKPAQEKRLTLEKHYHLGDTAKQYLDEIRKIEREVTDAITELGDNLRTELTDKRGLRKYEIGRDAGTSADSIPHVTDFK